MTTGLVWHAKVLVFAESFPAEGRHFSGRTNLEIKRALETIGIGFAVEDALYEVAMAEFQQRGSKKKENGT